MIDECIDYAEGTASDLLEAIYDPESLAYVKQVWGHASDVLDQIASLDEPTFFPVAVIYGGGEDAGPDEEDFDWTLISENRDNYEFLTSLFVLMSVMDIHAFAVVVDSYVVTGNTEDTTLTPAQRFALGDPAVMKALCVRGADKEGNIKTELRPYKVVDGAIQSHGFMEGITAPEDPIFNAIAKATAEVMQQPLHQRIVEYMNEFYDNEEVSKLHFEDTHYVREDAKAAIKKLEERNEIKYVQRIVEDGLMSSAKLYALERSLMSKMLDDELQTHMTSEDETIEWLTQARLML